MCEVLSVCGSSEEHSGMARNALETRAVGKNICKAGRVERMGCCTELVGSKGLGGRSLGAAWGRSLGVLFSLSSDKEQLLWPQVSSFSFSWLTSSVAQSSRI